MEKLVAFDALVVRDLINQIRNEKILSLKELAGYLDVSIVTLDYLMHPEEKHIFSFKIKRRIVASLNRWIGAKK